MNFKRMWAMLMARNREFFRDKASFGWNFLFPFLLIAGFAVIFGGREQKDLKFGIFPCQQNAALESMDCAPQRFEQLRYVELIPFEDLEAGLNRLAHHKIDLLIDIRQQPYPYWINETAPKGYIAEKVLKATLMPGAQTVMLRQESRATNEIRYVDWLFPGILAMNAMFSALYGVGFVVVRYRKNGVLKRLKATPLTAFEYLTAQMLSRLFVLMFTLTILWIGCEWLFDFQVQGSYINLAILFFVGCLSLLSLGLVIASRVSSEEFAEGVLNFITWPMMFLSEVWFSIEGAPSWVKGLAQAFPLTHLLRGVRSIMNDGAGLVDVSSEILILTLMTLIFLSIGASLFAWQKK